MQLLIDPLQVCPVLTHTELMQFVTSKAEDAQLSSSLTTIPPFSIIAVRLSSPYNGRKHHDNNITLAASSSPRTAPPRTPQILNRHTNHPLPLRRRAPPPVPVSLPTEPRNRPRYTLDIAVRLILRAGAHGHGHGHGDKPLPLPLDHHLPVRRRRNAALPPRLRPARGGQAEAAAAAAGPAAARAVLHRRVHVDGYDVDHVRRVERSLRQRRGLGYCWWRGRPRRLGGGGRRRRRRVVVVVVRGGGGWDDGGHSPADLAEAWVGRLEVQTLLVAVFARREGHWADGLVMGYLPQWEVGGVGVDGTHWLMGDTAE